MTVGWGFLGAGWIAQRAMAPAVSAAPNARLVAVASSEPSRAALLGPGAVHRSYDDLVSDPAVDVVYIALANHQHAEWAIRALQAGKHVLCEKPLALDAGQARAMAAAADAADRMLVEAVWTRWHPRFRRLVEVVDEGLLGPLTGFRSEFTFTRAEDGGYRSQPALGGGALMDVGGYQAHALIALASSTDPFVVEWVERVVGPTGIDVTTRVAARAGGAVAVRSVSSFDLPERQGLTVTGERASAMPLGPQAFTSWREPTSLQVGSRVEHFEAVDAYAVMVENVSAAVDGGAGWVVPLTESLRAAEILDAVAASGSGPASSP